jgi:ADP-ribose pyrophosphatase YjhB (NUDIX family)
MKFRIITGAIIVNKEQKYLFAQMAADHGVYPNQWGIIGGGVDPDEEIDHAVIREIREESNLKVHHLRRLFFSDARRQKLLRGVGLEDQYLLFLIYEAQTFGEVKLNDEWQKFGWFTEDEALKLNLNQPTRENFNNYVCLKKAEVLPDARNCE